MSEKTEWCLAMKLEADGLWWLGWEQFPSDALDQLRKVNESKVEGVEILHPISGSGAIIRFNQQ